MNLQPLDPKSSMLPLALHPGSRGGGIRTHVTELMRLGWYHLQSTPQSQRQDSNLRYSPYEGRLAPSPVHSAKDIKKPLWNLYPRRLGNQITSIQLVNNLLPLHPTSKSRIVYRHKMTRNNRHTMSVCSVRSHIHFHHHCYVSHNYLPFCTKKHLSASFPFAF